MKKYILGLAFLWLFIFSIAIIPNEIHISVPDEYPRILIKTFPVDPRDLLRGDFVILSYEFSRNQNIWIPEEEKTLLEKKIENILQNNIAGTPVYITFDVQNDKKANIKDISLQKPSSDLFLAGKIRGNNEWSREFRFGIEKYFVPQGKGGEIESARNAEKLEAEIAIDPKTGKGLVTNLFISEKEVDFKEIQKEENL